MIELKNISKSFNGVEVLKDISITYQRGKTNLIIGASGSGKSVLTKCTVGLIEPDSGSVLFDGKDFTKLKIDEKQEIRKEIGMLFQGSALFDSMTVEENIKFPLRMHTNMNEEEMKERVNFCLDRVDMKGVNMKFPAEISGGMQKRVGIARAISLNPKYLFCDEPNSGLDPSTSILIDNLIKEITEEYQITTIVVTHDMNSVMEIGDKVIFIYKGEKFWEGTKDTILQTTNKELSDLVFASRLMKKIKSTS
ncbi:MAG: ATP-binding cassette domain-containing protein [Bacteroidetes bacterium]|nr:MAG: ATP-binding cassette domain-containing protein [Bacteroidota bacterium]MBL1143457.1 ATP-binding cassette domain-containing protein [Bacteroidota bacterium]MCB0802723.1 ATP-binding cassette domain-containing protein [Flavobacteriales bacterium]NOG56261.1 ATP-binding cassette domain-containing protein [Bacteroidota bacterium]